MLGSCSITYGDKTIDIYNLLSKKIWEILAYLIVYRDKYVSQSELIDVVYRKEKSNNPANALKTLMHRVRAAFEVLGVDGKNLIIQQNGSYKWNNKYKVLLDAESFDKLISASQTSHDDNNRFLSIARDAIALYRGGFLPRFSTESWVVPIHAYFHANYIRLIHTTIELLSKENRNVEIIEICQKAIKTAPYDEQLYLCLMRALINLELYQTAMEQYEKTTKLFYREFGVTPLDEIKALYNQIACTNQQSTIS